MFDEASNVQMNSLLNVFVVVLTSTYEVKCFTLELTEFERPDAISIYTKVYSLPFLIPNQDLCESQKICEDVTSLSIYT
jgi:hypothetical protein